MRFPTFCLFTIEVVLLQSLFRVTQGEFKIDQYWSSTFSLGENGALAVKANSKINSCTCEKGRVRFSDTHDNEIELLESNTLCRLRFNEITEDEDGIWTCQIRGDCGASQSFQRRREKRQSVAERPILALKSKPEGREAQFVSNLHSRSTGTIGAKSSRQRSESCTAEQEIELRTEDSDKCSSLASQKEPYYAEEGKRGVTMSVRVNGEPSKCSICIMKESGRRRFCDPILTANFEKENRDEICNRFSKVCLKKFHNSANGIYACNIVIDEMTADLEGTYNIEIEREINRIPVRCRDVEVQLIIESRTGSPAEVETNLPTLVNVIDENEDEVIICTDREEDDRETILVEFESKPSPSDVYWNMRIASSRFEERVELGDRQRGDFQAFQIEESKDVEYRYIAEIRISALKDIDFERAGHELVVSNEEGKSRFYITLDKDKICKATQNPGTGQLGVSGSSSHSHGGGSYSCNVNLDNFCRCDENGLCCDASSNCEDEEICCSFCDRADSDDVCRFCNQFRKACMKYEVAEKFGNYVCDPDHDRDCICQGNYCCDDNSRCLPENCCEKCHRLDRNCECDRNGRNCIIVKDEKEGLSDDIERKATKIMLDSCFALSSSLLEMYNPDGSTRDKADREEDFRDDLENFFESASCTKFDQDIQEYYENKDKSSSTFIQRGNSGVRFLSVKTLPQVQSSPLNKAATVLQTNAERSGLKQIISDASNVVSAFNGAEGVESAS